MIVFFTEKELKIEDHSTALAAGNRLCVCGMLSYQYYVYVPGALLCSKLKIFFQHGFCIFKKVSFHAIDQYHECWLSNMNAVCARFVFAVLFCYFCNICFVRSSVVAQINDACTGSMYSTSLCWRDV